MTLSLSSSRLLRPALAVAASALLLSLLPALPSQAATTPTTGGIDVSGDGNPDVLVRTTGGALVRYTTAGGVFTGSKVIGSGWNGFDLVFGSQDFDGDVTADLLARTPSGDLWLYPTNGADGFGTAKRIGWGWNGFSTIFSPGDWTGDGAADILAVTKSGDLWLYPGSGAGGFGAAASRIGIGFNGYQSIFPVGDFDGDGAVDFMARIPQGRLDLWRGTGTGAFAGPGGPALVGDSWNYFDYAAGVGDMDGDGHADVIGRTKTGDLLLYRGNGARGWGSTTKVGTGWSGLLFVG